MTGEFLDGPRRRPLHRQMRTERVPQDVHALFDTGDALIAANRFDHAIARDLAPLSAAVNRCVIGS